MKVKVLKNFSCNGVRKMAGQFLSEEEYKIMGDEFVKEFLGNDFLQMIEMEKEKPVKKAVSKKVKKEKKEKKIEA